MGRPSSDAYASPKYAAPDDREVEEEPVSAAEGYDLGMGNFQAQRLPEESGRGSCTATAAAVGKQSVLGETRQEGSFRGKRCVSRRK